MTNRDVIYHKKENDTHLPKALVCFKMQYMFI